MPATLQPPVKPMPSFHVARALGRFVASLAAGLALITARPQPAAAVTPEARRTPAPAVALASASAVDAAAAWLWSDALAGQCRVPALWGEAVVAARLGGLLKVSVRAAQRRPAVAARAAAWVSREEIEFARAADADFASRLITLDRGSAAVVRILKSPAVSMKRVRFGLDALAA